jgi:hypothetical protein
MLTPIELHGEPTVTSWVAIELDCSGDADRCGTENDRMIRVHPSSPVAPRRPTGEALRISFRDDVLSPEPSPGGRGFGGEGASASDIPFLR